MPVFKNGYNSTKSNYPLYDAVSSDIAVIFSILFTVIGFLVNVFAMKAIMRPFVREKSFASIFFYQCLLNMLLSITYIPLQAYRFITKENYRKFFAGACDFEVIITYGFVAGLTVSFFAMMGLHRALHVKDLADKTFTWKKTTIYIVVQCLIRIVYLILPITGTWGKITYVEGIFNCAIEYDICRFFCRNYSKIIYAPKRPIPL